MKKIFTLLVLLTCFCGFSQNKISEKIAELKAARTVFTPFSVLNATTPADASEVESAVDNATFAALRVAEVNSIVAAKNEAIELSIPYAGGIKVVELYKVEILADNFTVDSDKALNLTYQQGVHYRGIVKGDPNSLVSMNFFANEFSGIISDNSVQNLVVGKIDKPNNTLDYIVYSDADMKVPNGFRCDVKDEDVVMDLTPIETSRNVQSTRCVTVYFEIDHNLFLANGADTTTTTNWMTAVFNNVQTLYANDQIDIALSSVFIWTTDDPYEGESSFDYLAQFNEVRPVFNGDVGMLVGIDPGGLGGVAVTINGLCSENNFSYSDVNFSYSTVPTYSWTVMVITHELGHLLGSRHTHACAWNGNNTAIDGCGQQAGNNEGNCSQGPIPTSGSIMSYCHLISGVGINFTNGFGTQPRTAVLNAVNSGLCLSTDCVNTCINTVVDITATNVTSTSATITWGDVGSTTAWQISITPYPSSFPNWTNATSPHQLTGLLPNKYYRVRLRPVCSGLTPTSRETVFATSADWCSGVVITDTGGATGDHGNMESYVRTLIPTQPNKKITLTFTEFDLETDYDYLYVYDGSSTSAPEFNAGGYTGNTIPGPFVSSAADGSLSIRFASDQAVVESGYVATVGCEDLLGLSDVANIDFTYYPNPTNGVVKIVSKTDITNVKVYNIAGQLLYQNKLNNMETDVDISAFATGTYFFRLMFDDIEANFKVLKL